MLVWIISEFHNNFTLEVRKKATAPGSVQKIVQTMGPDGLFIVPAHWYIKWVRKTNKILSSLMYLITNNDFTCWDLSKTNVFQNFSETYSLTL